VALDPISAAPDEQMRELVYDFLAAQRSPGTRASYASDLAMWPVVLAWSSSTTPRIARCDASMASTTVAVCSF
jgi:hypothetical protein